MSHDEKHVPPTEKLQFQHTADRETIEQAEDEDMFGDNIEASVAPDSPTKLHHLKEHV